MRRVIIAISAALAITLYVNAPSAFSQEAPETGTSVDAGWDRIGPTIDEDAASGDKVLEIPQAACTDDSSSVPCDSSTASADDDDNDQAINAPQPGAPPSVYDDDTASAGTPDSDWGDANDYQNQQVYAVPVPYGVYPYPGSVTVARTNNQPSPVPASAYAPMSSPVTQAALPPLSQGPWMNPPTMSAFARPAGSPMIGMRSFAPSFGFHH